MKKTILTLTLVAANLLNQAQVVSTFAGSGAQGSIDATATAASFNNPYGVCSDASGNIYVADYFNHKIRKITSAGVVTTFAGSGAQGSSDGAGISASFNYPIGVCSDISGNIYVADYQSNKIRKITSAGVVTTFAGSGSQGSVDATGTAASFFSPSGVCSDASGNIYVADYGSHKIRKISPAGVVTTFAGSGSQGSMDATGTMASFNFPAGVCSDASGNIYVADYQNSKIRKITTAGVVTTLAGSGANGSIDAGASAASFNGPFGVCSDAAGNIYVADFNNNKIRKISTTNVVTTFAGSGAIGSINATGTAASFNKPIGICSDPNGNIYVADRTNHKIRKIDALSTNITEKKVTHSVVHIYPNPTSSVLTIQTNEIIESIKIYNVLGLLVQTEEKNTFTIEQLPVGIYSLKIKTDKGITNSNFIKN